jgi:hypothetical protein
LGYHYYMIRRDKLEDRDNFLEAITMYLAPENWVRFFRDQILGGIADPEGEPVGIEDLAEMDKYFEEKERAWRDEHQFQQSLHGTHTMSGAQAPNEWAGAQMQPLQWGPWV